MHSGFGETVNGICEAMVEDCVTIQVSLEQS
jgi:hypothetical protein